MCVRGFDLFMGYKLFHVATNNIISGNSRSER